MPLSAWYAAHQRRMTAPKGVADSEARSLLAALSGSGFGSRLRRVGGLDMNTRALRIDAASSDRWSLGRAVADAEVVMTPDLDDAKSRAAEARDEANASGHASAPYWVALVDELQARIDGLE